MRLSKESRALWFAFCVAVAAPACGSDEEGGEEDSGTESTEEVSSVADACEGTSLSTSAWPPNISGAGSGNRDSNVSTTVVSTETGTGPLTGLAESAAGKYITFNVKVCADPEGACTTSLGERGSISLVGETTGISSALSGGAYPLLVSFVDPTGDDWIGMSMSGGATSGSGIATGGFYNCPSNSCSQNASWTVGANSSYLDREDWEQHQVSAFAYLSTNTFPTCRWSTGTHKCGPSEGAYFTSNALPPGTWTAKYILLADSYSFIGSGHDGEMKLTVVKKKETTTTTSGAIDLNFVLVGAKNIADAGETKGQANLNALLTHVHNHFSQAGTGIKLGAVNAYEWDCDAIAEIDLSLVGELFEMGTGLVPSSSEARAINVFMVSSFVNEGSELTVLGLAGGITGPMIHGTRKSGLAFASFDELAAYNPLCSGSTCAASNQEASFIDMGSTISHELGHYLGLNHPTERDAGKHDRQSDTPECDTEATLAISSSDEISVASCKQAALAGNVCNTECPGYNGTTTFCPTQDECQWNHVMWYTGKNYSESLDTGDGNLFSTNSGIVLNFSPYVQ